MTPPREDVDAAVSAGTRLEELVAVVTGAGGGIGSACVAALVAGGARVVATDVTVPVTEADASPRLLHAELDVRRPDEWERALDVAEAAFGGVDVLVNAAGILRTGGLSDAPWEDLDPVLDVNLKGVLLGMRHVVPRMVSRGGGSIVNLGSIAALGGYPKALFYGASKWAVRGASRSAAIELGPLGIRVNCVCPGAIDTPLASDEARAGGGPVALTPLARIGTPREVGDVVVFLASAESSYCSGQDFIVDGGRTA